MSAEAAGGVRTGAAGLLIGRTARGSVTVRLFRERPTRIVLATPHYVSWLLAYRSVSLGAHVSVVSQRVTEWQGLAERITAAGGTADLVDSRAAVPGAGRPYRPSLVLDDLPAGAGVPPQPGAWQAWLTILDPELAPTVALLRLADLTLFSPPEPRVLDGVRRAYFLDARQLRSVTDLATDEVVLAMPRRLQRIALRPGPLEYQALFVD